MQVAPWGQSALELQEVMLVIPSPLHEPRPRTATETGVKIEIRMEALLFGSAADGISKIGAKSEVETPAATQRAQAPRVLAGTDSYIGRFARTFRLFSDGTPNGAPGDASARDRHRFVQVRPPIRERFESYGNATAPTLWAHGPGRACSQRRDFRYSHRPPTQPVESVEQLFPCPLMVQQSALVTQV